MDSDYTTILRLDEDFKNGLGIINPFISGLRTQNYVRLCRLWIDKLIHCAPHERPLRNVYLEQLCRHSQLHVLGTPFNCPPNEGPLQVIPQQYLIRQGVVLSKHQTVASQHEETASWSDISDTSYDVSASTWQPVDAGEESLDNLPIKKTASSTVSTTGAETACTETTHRIRFKHSRSSTQNFMRRKCQKKAKRQNGRDSNDDLVFKDCYENPVRSKSVASRSKNSKKTKKVIRADNCLKSSESFKVNKSSGNAVKKKLTKRNRAKVETEEEEEDVEDEDEEEEVALNAEENDYHSPKKTASKNISIKENVKSDSKEAVVEMYKNYGKQIQNTDEDKIMELENKIIELKNENQSIIEQLLKEKEQLMAERQHLMAERDKKDELNNQLDSLKNEMVNLKEKLLTVEKMKQALEKEHKEVVDGISDSLASLLARVNSAVSKNDKIESIVTKLNNDTENNIQLFQKEMSNKCKALEQDYEEKLSEIKKCHTQTVQSYESTINKLKKELSNKNKEKMKLEKKLQEKCCEMRNEVENIKQEIERASKENEIQLNAKINSYKSKIIKLVKYNQKTAEFYEQKINALNKTKDMELWVQKLNVGSALTNGKKQEMENIISALEQKFRKQLNDATQRTYDYIEQKHKYEEITSELGSDNSTNDNNTSENKDENKNEDDDKQ